MSDLPLLGFLNINKPLRLTSHDVVNRVRRKLGLRQVGHAGTLDPLASGVLIVCVGFATRLSDYAMAAEKEYRAHVHFGIVTDTDDAEGKVVAQVDAAPISLDAIHAILPTFTGEITQVPPRYSAIKKDGKKLYELARAGKNVDPAPRSVHISAIEVVAWQPPVLTLNVTCGSGTYIRSLARDLGEALSVGAHLSGLERTRSGTFTLQTATDLPTFEEASDPRRYLLTVQDVFPHWQRVLLTAEQVLAVRNGKSLPQPQPVPDAEMACAESESGEFVALLQSRHGTWHPFKVSSS